MATTLENITIRCNPDGTVARVDAVWQISGTIGAGFRTSTTAERRVTTKGLTDALQAVVSGVVAEGPPSPPV